MTVTIVDYGVGNIGSIVNMLKSLGKDSRVSNNPKEIELAEKLILPGVGAFDQGVEKLHRIPFLVESIKNKVEIDKKPLLGICLGMQLLMDKSEEGDLPGLGLIPGKVAKFGMKDDLINIHMGWNTVNTGGRNNKLIDGFSEEMRFYFVHGYYVIPKNDESILATTDFGKNFCSVVNQKNLWGVQFHPEKSHKFGKFLLQNFCDLEC